MLQTFGISSAAYVDAIHPTTNFYDSGVKVGSYSSDASLPCIGLFKFYLTNLPDNARITGGVFRINKLDTTANDLRLNLVYANSNWVGETVKWSTKPSMPGPTTYIDISAATTGILSADVSTLLTAATRPYITIAACPVALNDKYPDYFYISAYTSKLDVYFNLPAKIAGTQGSINKDIKNIMIAPIQGAINKSVTGMKIAPVQGAINKTVF